MKPMIGISGCTKQFGAYAMPNHAASDTYVRAVTEVMEAVPVIIPACPLAADCATLLDRLDGILLTGSRSNVQPSLYGGPAHPDDTPEDPSRDAATLPLIRAAVAAGVPVLAICRGLQELNVALGGSLHQRLQDLPGRIDHATPMVASAAIRIAKAHAISMVPGSWLHGVARDRTILVNSLHNQGIDRLAAGLVVEATAPDGTIEAVRAVNTAGFAVGVQWHPEYDFRSDAMSRRIFLSFAAAIRARAMSVGLAAAD